MGVPWRGRRRGVGRPSARSVGSRFATIDTDAISPAGGGQLLLAGAGLTVAVGASLLRPGVLGWYALAVVSSAMVAALVASRLVPWRRLPARATLVFPLLVCAGLAGLAALSEAPAQLAAPLTGVLVLCAAYVGLVQPAGSILLVLPFFGATFVLVNEGFTRITSVRLVIASVVWTLLAEVLAHLTQRFRDLSHALRAAAQTDVLTGVGNRREIDLRLAVSQPGDAVVLCDLDHFKSLNDTRGHLFGDRVLADFGAMLRAELREGDVAGRFGGEEFLLLLRATPVPAAAVLVARLHTSWALIHPGTTFSAGLAGCLPGRSAEDAVAAADRSLYAAKAAGRDCTRTEQDLDAASL